jgi:dienelactone hydrolase
MKLGAQVSLDSYNWRMILRDPSLRRTTAVSLIISAMLLVGCGRQDTTPVQFTPTETLPQPTVTLTISPQPTVSPTPAVTSTPDPYRGMTIADLQARSYGGDDLAIVSPMDSPPEFTRALFRYPSDGLEIYGFMNVPKGEGPFPVVLVLHGFVNTSTYQTLGYTRPYADAFAREGFLVLHPNYRNHPPSQNGPDPFRVGYAIDVLNLLALVRRQGGMVGPLVDADPERIGIFGHSMGGGITIRVVTVDPDVDAAVLYGAMSGDEKKNYERVLAWTNGEQGRTEYETDDADLVRISPIYHYEDIQTPLSVHHGDADPTVPPEWSTELCEKMQALGKRIECFNYPGQVHIFSGESNRLLIERAVEFFNRELEVE